MNKTIITLMLLSGLTACVEPKKEIMNEQVNEQRVLNAADLIERGRYLSLVGGCGDCHSPKKFNEQGEPVADENLLFSGHPANLKISEYDAATAKKWALLNEHNTACVGPWGVSFAANISSDETGIGNWSEAQFIKAMREGKYKGLEGSRMLLPPMPWPNFAQMTDEDLKALFAFLKSTKPVANIVPPPMAPAAN